MNKLETILKQKNISQSKLASHLQVSRQRVSNWIRGINYPNRKYMKLIAEYLGISIDKLFYDEKMEEFKQSY